MEIEANTVPDRVQNQDSVALLGIVPADGKEHHIGRQPEKGYAALGEGDREENGKHCRDHDAGEPVARRHDRFAERLPEETPVKDLVRVREVGVVHEVSEE